MLGLFMGAKAGNQASGSGPPVSAVPLLPAAAIGNPANARVAVPSGEVTTARRVVTTKSITGRERGILRWTVGLLWYTTRPSGKVAFRTMRGFHSVPRLPQAA